MPTGIYGCCGSCDRPIPPIVAAVGAEPGTLCPPGITAAVAAAGAAAAGAGFHSLLARSISLLCSYLGKLVGSAGNGLIQNHSCSNAWCAVNLLRGSSTNSLSIRSAHPGPASTIRVKWSLTFLGWSPNACCPGTSGCGSGLPMGSASLTPGKLVQPGKLDSLGDPQSFAMSSNWFSSDVPLNSGRPVIISARIQPIPHMSIGGPYFFSPASNSGGRYHRVTTMLVYRCVPPIQPLPVHD